jgi:hypothetical protein
MNVAYLKNIIIINYDIIKPNRLNPMCITFVRLRLILEYTKLINMLGRSLAQTL